MRYNILGKANTGDHTRGLPFDAEVVGLKLQYCDIFWDDPSTTTTDSEIAYRTDISRRATISLGITAPCVWISHM
jgi:hypothetical protein